MRATRTMAIAHLHMRMYESPRLRVWEETSASNLAMLATMTGPRWRIGAGSGALPVEHLKATDGCETSPAV